MNTETFDQNDPESQKRFHNLFGPQQVDGQVRQAITMCWMALPDDKKTVDEVEKQVRRIVDRALRDLRDDSEAFGIGGG